MTRNIVRVGSKKSELKNFSKRLNENFKERNIKREAIVVPVSESFVRNLTRKGFKIPKKNFGVAVRNKR